MGTLVGLRYGLGRNYTGSLMELNNCGYTTGSCDEEKFQDLIMTSNNNSNDNNNNNSTEPKQPWNNPNDNNNKLDNLSMALWISKHSRTFGAYEAHLETSSLLNSFALDMHDFSNCHLFTEKPSSSSTSASNSSNAKNLLGLTQLIGLSRLMNFIMYKSRQSNNASSSSSNSNDNNNSNNNNNNSNPLEDAHRQYHGSTFTDYIFARAQMEQKARRRSYYYPILQTLSHSSSLNTSLTCINELKHTGVVDTESFLENFLHKQRKRRHYNSESGLLLPETDNLSTLQNDSQEGGDPQCENNEENNPDYDENTVNLCDDVISSIDSKETETSTLSSEVNMNATESENDSTSESMAENSKSDENVSTSSPSSPSSLCTSVDNDMDNESKVNINKTDPQCSHETVNNTTTTTNPIPNDQSNVITASNIMKSNDAIDDQDGSCDQAEETTIINTSLSKENLKLHKSVSFADEVGKSLTEIFILYDDDDEENEHSHEYEELFGVSYYGSSKHEISSNSPYRRSKFEIFCGDTYLDFNYNTKNHNTSENHDTNGTYKRLNNTNTEPHYTWSLTFSQPASHYYEFRQKLERNSISLESISVIQSTDKPKTSFIKLSGTIKVKNISFEKSVYLRLTKNNWKSFTDYHAVYSAQLSSGTWSGQRRYDTFVFNIIIQSDQEYFHPDEKIEFAICFTTVNNDDKTEYWDNYDGKNYVIEQRKFHPLLIGTESLTHQSTEISSPSSDSSMSPVNEIPLNNNNNNKSINNTLDRYSNTSAITKPTITTTNTSAGTSTTANTTSFNTSSYTLDCRPNFDSFTSFTDYRAWSHYSGETSYY